MSFRGVVGPTFAVHLQNAVQTPVRPTQAVSGVWCNRLLGGTTINLSLNCRPHVLSEVPNLAQEEAA